MKSRGARAIASLIAIFAVVLLVAPPAYGQQASAEDQYVDSGPAGNGIDFGGTGPTGDNTDGGEGLTPNGLVVGGTAPAGSGSDSGDPSGSRGDVASVTGTGDAAGGSLPFTEYPVTPPVGLALLLIAIAITIGVGMRIVGSRPGKGLWSSS